MDKVLMFMAHPDDEIIFGWPVTQDKTIEKHLILCCDDYTRYGSKRFKALCEVCNFAGIKLLGCFNFDNNFYAYPTRGEDLALIDVVSTLRGSLRKALDEESYNLVFTHDPWGEYGHFTNKLVFEIVCEELYSVNGEGCRSVSPNLLITDICIKNKTWPSTNYLHPPYSKMLEGFKEICELDLDMDFYNKCEGIYRGFGAWTWGGHDPVTKCSVFELEG